MAQIFTTLFFQPILNILLLLYVGFLYVKIPGAFGFAIIGLTIVIRLLLHPVFKNQLEMSKKMSELKPHLDRLNEKHKNDQKTLQQEQMKLYQQAGINPASGCLSMIIQLPVFYALYQVLYEPFKHGSLDKAIIFINKLTYFTFLKLNSIDPWFFGFNLALSPKQAGLWYYLAVPLITGVLQYYQAVYMTPPPAVSKDGKKEEVGEFQKAMGTQMKYIFPVILGWFSYTLPVGLSLYWNIFSLFSIIQGRQLYSKPKTEIK